MRAVLDEALAVGPVEITLANLIGSEFTWEIIVVDDGSKDNTKEVAYDYAKRCPKGSVRVLVEYSNRGKGGAIRMGVLSCRGRYILMADADGATTFSEVEKLEGAMKEGYDLAVGSRSQRQEGSMAKRAWYRNVLMVGFNFLVQTLSGIHGIDDTQCGFKIFSRRAARSVFHTLHLERWAFDIEILYVASRLHYRIAVEDWAAVDCRRFPFSGRRLREAR